MKKVITILVLTFGVLSCKKEEPKPTTGCTCQKNTEQLGSGGNWYVTTQGTPYSDECSKNGTIEQITTMTRYRYTCW